MNKRYLASFVAILALVFGSILAGCGDSNVETVERGSTTTTPAQQPAENTAPSMAHATAGEGGITWAVPDGWRTGPDRPMRVATYDIGEGATAADCAVFYFGPGQGGDVQSNIERWIGQFEQPDGSPSANKATVEKREINGLNVTTIDLSGTYTASMGGPMSGKTENRPGYRMLGAIVEAPKGPVFFKFTGPEQTVTKNEDAFSQMVESVKPTGAA